MRSVLFLGFAIIFEVFGSTMLKLSNGLTELYPSIGVLIGFTSAFSCLGLALRRIALSTAYAIWSGLGTAATACVGLFLFKEDVNLLKVIAILCIVFGVYQLNKSKGKESSKRAHAL